MHGFANDMRMSQKFAVMVAGMTVYTYHGKGRGVKPQQLARYSCVLTTYTSKGMEAGPRNDAKHGTNPGQPIELEDSGNDDDAAVTGNADFVTLLATRHQARWRAVSVLLLCGVII